jgi:hypothetical protein
LVDCDDITRVRRLTGTRGQPELASPTILNWAAFLRQEARQAKCERLDTSSISLDASVLQVCAALSGDPLPPSRE